MSAKQLWLACRQHGLKAEQAAIERLTTKGTTHSHEDFDILSGVRAALYRIDPNITKGMPHHHTSKNCPVCDAITESRTFRPTRTLAAMGLVTEERFTDAELEFVGKQIQDRAGHWNKILRAEMGGYTDGPARFYLQALSDGRAIGTPFWVGRSEVRLATITTLNESSSGVHRGTMTDPERPQHIRYAPDGKIAFEYHDRTYWIAEPADGTMLVGTDPRLAGRWILDRYGLFMWPERRTGANKFPKANHSAGS